MILNQRNEAVANGLTDGVRQAAYDPNLPHDLYDGIRLINAWLIGRQDETEVYATLAFLNRYWNVSDA